MWKVILITDLGETAEECAIEIQKIIEGHGEIKDIIRYRED
jgi:hypothetical protein